MQHKLQLSFVDSFRNQDMTTMEILHRLVAIDTSHADGVRDALDFVESYLKAQEISCRRVSSIDGASQSLIATIGDNARPGGICLVGHIDVQQAEHSTWALDPFTVYEHEATLSGLGVAQMKTFIAVILSHASDFKQRRLPSPIHIVITSAHETVICSSTSLIREFASAPMRPRAVILGNPTSLRVAKSHKGHHLMATSVRGAAVNAAHNNQGVNAVWLAAHLIDYLEKIHGESRNFVSDVKELEPPWTSINVGNLSGGANADTMAGFASFEWEIRTIPEMKSKEIINQFTRYADAMVKELQDIAPRVAVDTRVLRKQPAFRVDVDSYASRLVAESTDLPPLPAASFVTCAPILQSAGFPVAICGPGEITYAGTPRESIELTEIDNFESLLFRLLDRIEHEFSDLDEGLASA